MQPVNNDMDDLIRKAAAGYPVIPQGADWQKVAQQLQASGNTAPNVAKNRTGVKILVETLANLKKEFYFRLGFS